jgi:hypothetical protein
VPAAQFVVAETPGLCVIALDEAFADAVLDNEQALRRSLAQEVAYQASVEAGRVRSLADGCPVCLNRAARGRLARGTDSLGRVGVETLVNL